MKKCLPIVAPGMNVDAGAAVGPLGHHPRNERHVQLVQHVGQPIDGDRLEARIAEDHFVERLARRVAVVGGLHVERQNLANVGQSARETASPWPGRALRNRDRRCTSSVAPASCRSARPICVRELVVQPIDQIADVVGHVAQVQPFAAADSRDRGFP